MQVERMFAWVVVVDNYFDHFVFVEDECVGICSVHEWITGVRTCTESAVECRDFGMDIGDVVEECTEGRT